MTTSPTASSTLPQWRPGSQALAIAALAGPIAVSQISRVGIGVVDTIFAGNVSAVGLAAVGLGSAIWMAIFFFITGVLLVGQSLIGSRISANDASLINGTSEQVWCHSLFWGLAAVPVLLASAALVPLTGVEPGVGAIVSDFLWVIALGAPASALFQGLKFSFDAVGQPSRGMKVGVFGFLINIPLNYFLVFGGLGVEGMGAIGCAWATTATYWLMLAALMWSNRRRPIAPGQKFQLLPLPDRNDQKYLFSKGLPTGTAILLDAGFFSAIAWLAVNFGTVAVAANQIAVNFVSLLFVGQIALSMSIGILVAQAESPIARRRIGLTGAAMSAVLSFVYMAVLAALGQEIVALYSSDPEVRSLAFAILSIAILFQFLDSIQVCASGALRGMHDTLVPMVIVGLAYWTIALPIALVLIHTDWLLPQASITDIWVGLAIGISTAAVLLALRFWGMTREGGGGPFSPKEHATGAM